VSKLKSDTPRILPCARNVTMPVGRAAIRRNVQVLSKELEGAARHGIPDEQGHVPLVGVARSMSWPLRTSSATGTAPV
jgi:hypothetical protein